MAAVTVTLQHPQFNQPALLMGVPSIALVTRKVHKESVPQETEAAVVPPPPQQEQLHQETPQQPPPSQ